MGKWYTAHDEVRSSGWANYDRHVKTTETNIILKNKEEETNE
jgi:hypothetical protein